MSSRKFSYVLVFVLLSVSLSGGQIRKVSRKELPPSAFKLIALKVAGTKRYTDTDILAATGLQIGESVSEDDFKKAAEQLGESGLFSNVAYTYQYSPEGTRVEFQLADNDKLVPARFENFVWFSDQQLIAELRKRVPLFKRELPLAGNMADEVSQALQVLLIAQKVEGRADYLRATNGKDGPIEAFDFSVTGPDIKIQKVSFSGAGAAEMPLLDTAAREIVGSDYLESLARLKAEKVFLPIFWQHGYLKAAISNPQATVLQQTPQETDVGVNFSVTPGLQYKVSDIRLSGYKAFPAEQIRPLLHLAPGQIANSVQLENDIRGIQDLYGSKGYMAASVHPVPEFDDAQSSVKYILQVHEGDVYKMGDLDIRGLDTRTTDRLVEAWKLRGGAPYDSRYPKQFIAEALKELALMGTWRSDVRQSVNPDKTVDVSIRFDPESQ